MIVGIVVPLLILIGIGVAVLALRKKDQGRQRALIQSQPARPATKINPVYAAAAIDSTQQTYAGGNDDDDDTPDGYTGDNSAV